MYFWLNYNLNIFKKYIKKYFIYSDYIKLYLKDAKDLIIVLKIFKLHTLLRFNILVDIACVDNLKSNKRFVLNYILLTLDHKARIVLSIDVEKDNIVPSIMQIFSSANWMEREVWDLYGIFFFNHIDLRRILTDYGFNGYPLRKDFPLNGFFEIRYDEDKQYLVYEPLELMQNMRFYDFVNPFYKKYII